MKSLIGVDVGGTRLRAARFTPDLELLDRTEQATVAADGPDAVFDRLVETIRQVLPPIPSELGGIGVALPGPLDADAGILIAPPNLPFSDTPIGQMLRNAVGGPVFIGNDADLAGLAEYRFGAGQGARSMVYITISTGIGGGLVLDGRLHHGRGQAGEIGHMVVDPDGPLCGCGRQGHLEAIASGTALARAAREALAAGADTLLREAVGGDPERITGALVGAAALEGDRLAQSIVQQAGRALGIAVASLMALLNPDRFVLGGGVTALGTLLFDPLHEAVREYALHPRYYEDVPIVPAELGDDVGLIGAASLAAQQLGE